MCKIMNIQDCFFVAINNHRSTTQTGDFEKLELANALNKGKFELQEEL